MGDLSPTLSFGRALLLLGAPRHATGFRSGEPRARYHPSPTGAVPKRTAVDLGKGRSEAVGFTLWVRRIPLVVGRHPVTGVRHMAGHESRRRDRRSP
jgi:hypothetical protein